MHVCKILSVHFCFGLIHFPFLWQQLEVSNINKRFCCDLIVKFFLQYANKEVDDNRNEHLCVTQVPDSRSQCGHWCTDIKKTDATPPGIWSRSAGGVSIAAGARSRHWCDRWQRAETHSCCSHEQLCWSCPTVPPEASLACHGVHQGELPKLWKSRLLPWSITECHK